MAAAHARDAARAVAAAHQALARTRWMGAMLYDVARCVRIVRAIAAGIEMDLGLGAAHGAESQRECNE